MKEIERKKIDKKEVIEIGDNISDYKRGFADATVQQIEIMKKDKEQIKKNILDRIDNRIKLHSLVLIKNKMKKNQFLDYSQHYMKSLREGLREAKNIIIKEFGDFESEN